MKIAQRRSDQSHGRLVAGDRHMVSAGHSAAATAALLVLEAGGNAVDAGVAAGLVLGVVQSDIVNVAGVAPMMIRSGATGDIVTIDGLGVWPAAASSAYFRQEHGGAIPPGLLRTVTPAAPAAWLTALARFGTMSFSDVAASAIRLATEGFPVHPTMADYITAHAADYALFPDNAALYLPHGAPPALGHRFVQAELGATLAHMAAEERASAGEGRIAGLKAAKDAFYRGDIAQTIAAHHASAGGWMTRDDLASYDVRLSAPVKTSWRNAEIFTCGPWCQGPVLAQILTIIGHDDVAALGHNSPAYIHFLAEAMKIAFADREATYGDPDVVAVPLAQMLSGDYGARQRRRIDAASVFPGMPPSDLARGVDGPFPTGQDAPPACPDTSYVAVVDRWGNAFSATPSDTSCDTPLIPGTGLCPSSRGSQGFTVAGHPSEVQPGKRPRLTPNPAMAIFDGEIVMPFGTPGGDVQTQSMLQVLLNIAVFDMDLVAAVEAPRFATYSFPNSFEPHQMLPGRLMIEDRVEDGTIAALRDLGHDARPWPAFTAQSGAVCAVLHHAPSGLKIAAADPRRNTGVAGW
ncbi:gamma-glutamyltransferase family protein [Chelatococcus sp. GCM10030263]|uniref:gamma-glutamyltransferase family protein n=1 Tax=Chelatococcus sp. GCM10030263 TaxID=3273387 RepID=UPI0036115EBB